MDLKRSDKSQFVKCLKNWLHDRPYYHILSEFLLDTLLYLWQKSKYPSNSVRTSGHRWTIRIRETVQHPCSQSNCKLQQNISGNLIESPLAIGWTEALCCHYVLRVFSSIGLNVTFTVFLLIGGFVPEARIEKLLLTLPH